MHVKNLSKVRECVLLERWQPLSFFLESQQIPMQKNKNQKREKLETL